jgi:5'-3' exonuclease
MLEKSLDALWKVKDGRHGEKYSALYCAIDKPPYERKKVFAEYKANRDGAGIVYHEEYKRLQERARGIGFSIVESQGHEADDVIATLVKDGEEWDIYTNDKDLLQLVSSKVTVVSTFDFSVRGEAEVIEKFGVSPSILGDWLALVGDSSDNIPGCPSIGAKTATKIIAGTGGLVNLFQLIDKGLLPIGCTPKLVETIRANREQIIMSRKLIELNDAVEVTEKPHTKEEPKSMDHSTSNESISIEDHTGIGFTKSELSLIVKALGHSGGGMSESGGPVHVGGRGQEGLPELLNEYREYKLNQQDKPPSKPPMISDDDMREARGPAPAAIVRTESSRDDAIELRPGMYLTSAKYALMKQLASNFHDGGLYGKKFGSPQAIFTVMMLGLELGISPQVSCQNFHIIEGKPSPSAHFLIAMAKRDADCVYLEMVEETPDGVTYVTKKKSYGQELRFTYTVTDAKNDMMKWAGHNSKNHRAMLRKTAGCQAARLWYPAACSGLYSQEELGYDSEEVVA